MKLIVFDIDGTLSDTTHIDDVSFLTAVKEVVGINISRDWVELSKPITSGTDTATLNLILDNLYNNHYFFNTEQPETSEFYTGESQKTRIYKRIKNRFLYLIENAVYESPDEFKEVSGAKGFVDYLLQSVDYCIAFATGSWERSGLAKLNSIGIQIEGLAYSNSDFHSKRFEIIRHAIGLAKLINNVDQFESITYFGDGVWDLEAAKLLNIGFAGIDYIKNGKLSALGVRNVLSNYDNPPVILSKIESSTRGY